MHYTHQMFYIYLYSMSATLLTMFDLDRSGSNLKREAEQNHSSDRLLLNVTMNTILNVSNVRSKRG